ncbi:hypothetical protein JTB14_024672 [Gonioctena quinquepunctata]|nr:hypothetical protein JTB14_024672 [Gonioctena quinquepunctata]
MSAQHADLREYLLTCSKMAYGLTLSDGGKLAFDMATANELKMPQSWTRNEIAGKTWIPEETPAFEQTKTRSLKFISTHFIQQTQCRVVFLEIFARYY